MNWIWVLFLIIVLIVLCILFVGINISFMTEYKDKKFHLRLRVYILNSIFGKDIKFNKKEQSDLDNTSEESTEEASEEKTEESMSFEYTDNGEKSIKELISRLKAAFRKYLSYKDAFFAIRDKIRKKLVFKYLNISIDYGDGDAHTTAVATGTMWGFIYNILAFITKTATVKKHKEIVNPRFNERVFSLSVDGILRVRLVHIIYAWILFNSNYKKILNRRTNPQEKKKGV
ncbi:MAG: DUF2953 domain-containing protein [Ruminococcaceae bacterium]|nr:DUF2953 domain-containing protein [Oscillospiraceae bacterium]